MKASLREKNVLYDSYMVRLVKVLDAKPGDLSSSPELIYEKKRTGFCKFSFDLHMYYGIP